MSVGPTVIAHFNFFSGFPREQRRHLAEHAERKKFEAGQTIFKAGDSADAMYLILSGKVRIYRNDDQGDEIELGVLSMNEVFGELAMLTGEPRMATATTLEACEFMVITNTLLQDVVSAATPEAILKVFAVLSNQIRATNEREFQELLAKQMLEAQMEVERQRALTQMVTGVAHEINTPLGIINTATSMIQRQLNSDVLAGGAEHPKFKRTIADMQEAFELLQKNVLRAHKLTQDFKKVSASQLSDTRETLSLPETVNETVGLFAIGAKKNNLTIMVHDKLPEGGKSWMGYRGYLSQVLLNLLTNVERYAYSNDGGQIDITLEADERDGEKSFVVTVRDQGKGIPPENLARIYEPFFTTGRLIGGTGLGMSIVYNIVTVGLRGTIEIQSEVDKGTTAIVRVPQEIPA